MSEQGGERLRRALCSTSLTTSQVIEVMDLFVQVGPISTEEFVSRTTHDEPLWGLSEKGHQAIPATPEAGRQP